MSTYLYESGGNWITKDAEISSHPPVDANGHEASCSRMLQQSWQIEGNDANRIGRHLVSVENNIINKYKFLRQIIARFVVSDSGPFQSEST